MGIRFKDGVVLGVEKLIISKMLAEGSNRRTFPVDRHAGVVRMHPAAFYIYAHVAPQAIAGFPADGRQIVNRGIAEAQQYKGFYGDAIPGHILAERLGGYVHLFNLYAYLRYGGVRNSGHRTIMTTLFPATTAHLARRRCWACMTSRGLTYTWWSLLEYAMYADWRPAVYMHTCSIHSIHACIFLCTYNAHTTLQHIQCTYNIYNAHTP